MATQGQQSWITVVLYFAVFLVIFYFFILAPRKKQEKKQKETLDTLKRGDKVVTIGGVRGVVAKIKEDAIIIKVNDSTEIEFIKSAIAHKVGE